MADEVLEKLGPLAALAGVWEGDAGVDVAPSPTREEMKTPFRERMVFDPFGPVNNHDQELYALRYATEAWRIGEDEPFHEELGYWLWDADAGQVMRCFMVPRGVTIVAGGSAGADDSGFKLTAELGSATFGICSNPFLDKHFQTIRYELELSVNGEILRYKEDTQMKMPGRPDIFHHLDANELRKAS
jgi:hypothetical protein